MNSSLSLLLPVHNSQATLQFNVQRVVEILPDLTHRFEVLIVDDGSTDATCEVAYELARDYPQIRVNRFARSLGWATTVAAKAPETRGEFLMIHSGGELKVDDVVGLWRLRKGIAEAARLSQSKRGGKLWRFDPQAETSIVQAGAPEAVRSVGQLGIHARAPGSNLLMVHRQQVGELKKSLAALPDIGWPALQPSAKSRVGHPIKRPSFLSRAKQFALGE
ncbi:MAG: glycosyltransferase [Pirellulales bacterium]|nr:glycosyltransferase [Pirellulales bacterium]